MANFTVKNNILIGKELEYPEAYQNAGEILLEIFQKKPDLIGQIDAVTGKTVTYKEMREKTIKCAIWLKQQGIKEGDVVAICTSCCFDNYQIIFLHEFATKNLMTAENELNTKIQRILFEDGVRNEVSLADILSKISLSEVEKFRCAKIEDPNQVVMYVSTSGTTGVPKLAQFTHLSLKTMLNPAYSVLIKDKISMCIAGLRWVYAILFIMSAFRGNSTRIIVEDYKDAKYYGEIMKKHKVEYYGADTNQVRQIYKLDLIDLYRSTSLKIIRFAGSSFGREIHQKISELLPNIEFLQLYGLTDVGNCLAAQIDKHCKPGGCGYVRAGVKLKIVNTETGEILGANRQGEVCAMTDSRMKGYLNNPEMTNKAIDSEGWVHTGDIGYYDDDGELFIVGRMSEFIKYNDACLSVTEMESVLERHPAVYRAAVVAIPAEVEGEIPVAFVIKVPNKEVTVNELMTHFQNNIPDFYFLSNIMFVNKYPTTSTGKVSKNDLKQLLKNEML